MEFYFMTKVFWGFLVEKLNFSVEIIHRYEWFLCNFVFKTMLLSFDIFKKPWVLNSSLPNPDHKKDLKVLF